MFSNHVEIILPSWCLSFVPGVACHLPRHRRCTGSWRLCQATKGKTGRSSWATDGLGKKIYRLNPVKTWEISLILFNLGHLKNLSGNFQALVLVLIEKSSHSWQEQRSVHLNRAVPPRSSTAGFCPWEFRFQRLKIAGSSSSHGCFQK